MKKKKLTFAQRKALTGFCFCLPFLLGFIMFFLKPVLESIRYSVSVLQFDAAGLTMKYVGLKNFKEALLADPMYVRTIVESVQELIVRVPIVLIFSLFIALILNQKFHGRLFARAIFFLPVIVVNGIIIEILGNDFLSTSIMGNQETESTMLESANLLLQIGLPTKVIETMIEVISNIFDLVWNAGVPILLFLAALQTVSGSLYECARMEGATSWEMFWKITFPMISPMILMNTVYIMADYFTTSTNPVIKMINTQTSNMRFEYAAGLSWMYLLVVLVIIGIVYYFMNKRITYVVD